MLRWLIAIPFSAPVDPELYWRKARPSGRRRTASAPDASSISSVATQSSPSTPISDASARLKRGMCVELASTVRAPEPDRIEAIFFKPPGARERFTAVGRIPA